MTRTHDTAGDVRWMRRALELARRGLGNASPNPYVGCVIVKNGRPVGEGAHVRFGGPHAEVNALRRAGRLAAGATLYANLEPCRHWGKTPPCADAIIGAGIRKVVAAMPDPNPLTRGGGFRAMRRAGITVRSGICRREAEELNRSFIKFMTKKKPYVFLKSAVSLDGKIAAPSGESRWITSEKSRRYVHRLRGAVDAVLVGGATVRRDDPSLTSHGQGRDPVRIVLSASGRIPRGSKVLDGAAPTWILHAGRARPRPGRAEWIRMPSRGGKIPYESAARLLAGRGISRLLIEGGGETAAWALEAGEVDEAVFFIAPVFIGGRRAPTSVAGKGCLSLRGARRLEFRELVRLGPDILVRARAAARAA
ncbi:MAG: riboflavin biosynthesis protein RibD [Elusimicrobia bacterium RIFCSPLOWO2_01_FULL_64_13]|nr:MAG: riboflavin biosynthesis protein RibD [Elusimicrobia bacterium RIFCSPLOWO2_01_FULL_64_13]